MGDSADLLSTDMPLCRGRYRRVIRCLGPKLGPAGLSRISLAQRHRALRSPRGWSRSALRLTRILRFEQIASEGILTGLDLDGAADVRAVRWIGGTAVDITIRFR